MTELFTTPCTSIVTAGLLSLTLMVIVAVPDWLVFKFTVATAFEIVTAEMLTPLTRLLFELEPVNTRFVKAVSLSNTPNVKVSGTF